eukprot:NODE_159_length_2074_cov_70.287108_g135_i0.p1 GENE.NODE_159_length_2074_cov_70.287108_g135_i0~~NODE_159_length_2074_cov_70.287108_g135_i0.p1  ORF type:complete len:309 (-),score=11.94 NODE_159_length_2074_cov_70.287108_g135_i0:627-1553(-)
MVEETYPYSTIIAGVYTLVALIFLVLFLHQRQTDILKLRYNLLVLTPAVFGVIHVSMLAFTNDYLALTCIYSYWTSLLFVPVYTAYFFRTFSLWFSFYLNERIRQTKNDAYNGWMVRYRDALNSTQNLSIAYIVLILIFLLVSVAVFVFGVLGRGIEAYTMVQAGCLHEGMWLITVSGALVLVAILVSLYGLWGVRDGYFLKLEFGGLLAACCVLFPLWVASIFVPSVFPHPFKATDVAMWIMLASFIFSIVIPVFASFSKLKRSSIIELVNVSSAAVTLGNLVLFFLAFPLFFFFGKRLLKNVNVVS